MADRINHRRRAREQSKQVARALKKVEERRTENAGADAREVFTLRAIAAQQVQRYA